ncbi:putative 2-dehydropantoate 2-reductase [Verrucomicrobiota bacterium]
MTSILSLMKKRTYAIIGTGAVGGYYGALLQRAGFETHFLLHSDYEYVKTHGLRIDDANGDFTLPKVNAYASSADMPKCDVVIIALKTTTNPLLKEILPPIVDENTTVVALQNGLGSEQTIAECVKPRAILGGLSFVCCNKVGPGHIHHLDYGLISLGEYSPRGATGITSQLKDVAEDLTAAGIPIRMEDDLMLARWKKLMWNIPYNGLCALLNVTTDVLMADVEMRALVTDLMREVQAGAASCAGEISDEFLQQMIDNTDKMEPYLPSMMLDRRSGRPMELEAIYKNPLETARVPMPRTEMLYRQLRTLNH